MIVKKILKEYRVKNWVHYLGYVLLGSLISGNISFYTLFINLLISGFMLAFAYSMNDYYDKNSKRKKRRLFVLPLLFSLPLLQFLEEVQLIFYFLFILIFALYNHDKIYLEGKPTFSILSNSMGFLMLFFLPFTELEMLTMAWDISTLLFILNFAAQIIHEMVHYGDDKKIRKITTAVALGFEKSASLLRLVLVTIFIFSLFLFSKFKLVSLSTLMFSLYFLYLSRKGIHTELRKKFRYCGIICGMIYVFEFI